MTAATCQCGHAASVHVHAVDGSTPCLLCWAAFGPPGPCLRFREPDAATPAGPDELSPADAALADAIDDARAARGYRGGDAEDRAVVRGGPVVIRMSADGRAATIVEPPDLCECGHLRADHVVDVGSPRRPAVCMAVVAAGGPGAGLCPCADYRQVSLVASQESASDRARDLALTVQPPADAIRTDNPRPRVIREIERSYRAGDVSDVVELVRDGTSPCTCSRQLSRCPGRPNCDVASIGTVAGRQDRITLPFRPMGPGPNGTTLYRLLVRADVDYPAIWLLGFSFDGVDVELVKAGTLVVGGDRPVERAGRYFWRYAATWEGPPRLARGEGFAIEVSARKLTAAWAWYEREEPR